MRVFFFLLIATICQGQANPADVYTLCNPQSYTASADYWKVLIDYGLVNKNDQQAKQVVFQENFKEQVTFAKQKLNLFGGTEDEIVVKLNFANSSYYVHFFYIGADDSWIKMQPHLDYHVPNHKQKPDRLLNVKFAAIYTKGEYVLFLEKTNLLPAENSPTEQGNQYQSWLTIWRILPEELKLLHARKYSEKSYAQEQTTTFELEKSAIYPKTILFETRIQKEEYQEEQARETTTKTYRKERCQFTTNKEAPCQCAILQEETPKH